MIQKISYINELQSLRTSYYYHEAEKKRLRQMANKHAKYQREIFELIMNFNDLFSTII